MYSDSDADVHYQSDWEIFVDTVPGGASATTKDIIAQHPQLRRPNRYVPDDPAGGVRMGSGTRGRRRANASAASPASGAMARARR